jgi:serine/threonine kinase PknH
VPNSIRPGAVLADRYRLVDLLAESGSGRFWRAHDRILHRHVALHVIAADDERAPGLLEAARRSATVLDRRLLRVLDADQHDGVCYVVNEWGAGRSLDIILAAEGPLGARRAAWLVSEVAAAIALGHDAGVAHGRLVPENVLVDRAGSVRVIGFAVDAAMYGLPPGRVSADVADLGGLLYCGLTGRWPGVSRSAVPAAPHEHGRVLRPRQVRAGIPRTLDSLCDEVVNPYAAPPPVRAGRDLGTARGIAEHLRDFVGDVTGLAEAEVAAHATSRDSPTVVLPAFPEIPAPPGAEPESPPESPPEPEEEPASDPEPATAPAREQEPLPEPPPTPAPEPGPPTQAGLPIFGEDDDDVSWLAARSTPVAPPPPFDEPPERPLFAPVPSAGQPARTPRPRSASEGSPSGTEYWPWDTGASTGTGIAPVADEEDGDDGVPGRSWLRLAALLGAGLVLLVAIVVAFNLGRGKTPLGTEPQPEPSTTRSSSTPPAPRVITGLVASDFDPQGDPPEENGDLAPLAVDGDPATAWRTQTYNENLGPAGLKTGVGLRLDLGRVRAVSDLELTLRGAPTGVSVYVTREAPGTVEGLTPAASVEAHAKQRIALDQPVSGRFVTLWLTSLPAQDGGFRGEVAEVTVRG